MRKLTSLAAVTAVILSSSAALADGVKTPEPISDKWESEAARTVSLNATYVVTGILLAFWLVNAVNASE